jgi:hypothetical protein
MKITTLETFCPLVGQSKGSRLPDLVRGPLIKQHYTIESENIFHYASLNIHHVE